MSDLVGNPKNRFSRVEAQIRHRHESTYISMEIKHTNEQLFKHFFIYHEIDNNISDILF